MSIVVPVFNEVGNVAVLHDEVRAALADLDGSWELIFVDDHSTDGTRDVLNDLAEPEIRVVRHKVNAGQSAAVATGFRHARGAWVATLDGDCQNDPADLPRMLRMAVDQRLDAVTGVRRKRRDTAVKRLSSKIANGFRNWITGDRVTDSGCGIRLVRRACLREVPVFNGMHRFLPTLLRAQGASVGEMEVHHRERVRGSSKYGVHDRLWRGIRDCFGIRWYIKRAVSADRTNEPGQP